MHLLRVLPIILLNYSIGLLAGCTVGPDFKSPEAPDTKNYTESALPKKTVQTKGEAGKSQEFVLGQGIQQQWWRLFHSKPLNQLVERGLQNNPTVEAGQAALKQSKEALRAGTGSLFPAIEAAGSQQRERLSATSLGSANKGNTFELFNASVNVTYVLDVFGGARRNIESLCAGVENQRFILEGTYLTLTSNIVTTAITEASLSAQIKATGDLICSQEGVLKILEKQLELGSISQGDILTQIAQLAQTRATLPPLEKNLAQTRHALAVLVGSLPSEACLPHFYLNHLKLPNKVPVSFPSELVYQRPDVRAAKARLHQASAQIGVSTANTLPKFTLSGSYGGGSNAFNTLFNSPHLAWNYGIGILQPLFKGGTLASERRAKIAVFEEARAQYRQTVLQAFQNVADSLKAIEIDAKTLKAQVESEAAALNSLTLLKQQFQLGSINYLSLLNAERQYQLAHINRIQAEALRYIDTAALFQALGGGWWNCD
jgi:NodT family efflux transporter outer membrane factor (OMF) lipoprotein